MEEFENVKIEPIIEKDNTFQLLNWWHKEWKKSKILRKIGLIFLWSFVIIIDIIIMIQMVSYEANERESRHKRLELAKKLELFDLEIHETPLYTKKVWKLKPIKKSK